MLKGAMKHIGANIHFPTKIFKNDITRTDCHCQLDIGSYIRYLLSNGGQAENALIN